MKTECDRDRHERFSLKFKFTNESGDLTNEEEARMSPGKKTQYTHNCKWFNVKMTPDYFP